MFGFFRPKRFEGPLLAAVRAKAAACTTAAEAKALCKAAPDGSAARKIYGSRWEELEFEEDLAAINRCTTVAELRALPKYHVGDGDFVYACESKWLKRYLEIVNAEAPAKAAACTTAAETLALFNSAPDKSVAKKIYEARWLELHVQE